MVQIRAGHRVATMVTRVAAILPWRPLRADRVGCCQHVEVRAASCRRVSGVIEETGVIGESYPIVYFL